MQNTNTCADSIREVCPLFQREGGGAIPTSALQLKVSECSWHTFEKLNGHWHSRLPVAGAYYVNGMFFCAEYDGLYYAVAGWSAPIARMLNNRRMYELRRCAISEDAPENTASRFLSIMSRIIKARQPEICTLISYQDTEVHTGTIYKASGWRATRVSFAEDKNWVKTHPRASSKLQTTAPKVRWEKNIRPATDFKGESRTANNSASMQNAQVELDLL
jgi:hypothetical protein